MLEVVIVMAVIAILAGIAYPNYTEYVLKSRRMDCESVLFQLANAMERHYVGNNHYREAATGGADNGSPAIFPTSCPLDPLPGGETYYTLTIGNAGNVTYTLTATATGTQVKDKCGNLTLDQDKAKGRSGSLSVETCWGEVN